MKTPGERRPESLEGRAELLERVVAGIRRGLERRPDMLERRLAILILPGKPLRITYKPEYTEAEDSS